jgi:hypothetical protein
MKHGKRITLNTGIQYDAGNIRLGSFADGEAEVVVVGAPC